MNFHELCNMPLKLKSCRVGRNYKGGMLLEKWQGIENPEDGCKPEEWVASTVEAKNPSPVFNEGLSEVLLPDGRGQYLRDIISSYPESFLGKSHVERFGSNTGILVKVLDSCCRLVMQVHPDREYAKEILNSHYGKTEAWYVLGGRTIDGQDPYVLLGLKPGITKEVWKDLHARQDILGMENALHKINVKPGDVFLVEGGVLHAIGPGCLIVEIQEPTDITMKLEKVTPGGVSLTDEQCHMGVGFDKMLDCIHFNQYSRDELLKRYKLRPSVIRQELGGMECVLISNEDTPYFSMNKLCVSGSFKSENAETFSIIVVTSGSGTLIWEGGEMHIAQGDELFLPAKLGDIVFKPLDNVALELIRCFPPRA